jgi:hypothetical protein
MMERDTVRKKKKKKLMGLWPRSTIFGVNCPCGIGINTYLRIINTKLTSVFTSWWRERNRSGRILGIFSHVYV